MSWRRLEVDCTACPICSATVAFAPPPPPAAAAISLVVVVVAHRSLRIIRGPAQSTATWATWAVHLRSHSQLETFSEVVGAKLPTPPRARHARTDRRRGRGGHGGGAGAKGAGDAGEVAAERFHLQLQRSQAQAPPVSQVRIGFPHSLLRRGCWWMMRAGFDLTGTWIWLDQEDLLALRPDQPHRHRPRRPAPLPIVTAPYILPVPFQLFSAFAVR